MLFVITILYFCRLLWACSSSTSHECKCWGSWKQGWLHPLIEVVDIIKLLLQHGANVIGNHDETVHVVKLEFIQSKNRLFW